MDLMIRSLTTSGSFRFFLMSEWEFFRYVAALVPDASDADDIVQQMSITLREKFDSDDPDWACRFALNKRVNGLNVVGIFTH
jgi:DNA-directed RNA polymerase specialized sigma24 family protein